MTCLAQGGSPFGGFLFCKDVQCLGACCLPDEACTELVFEECREAGGVFQGPPLLCTQVICEGCATDTNTDRTTDVQDLVNVILDWGTAGRKHGGDVNGDRFVDFIDLDLVVVNWGPCESL